MDLDFSFSLMTHAMEKEKERSAWDLWVTLYPNFTKDTFVKFDDFMKKAFEGPVMSDKSLEEIEAEMEAVIKAYEERKVDQ